MKTPKASDKSNEQQIAEDIRKHLLKIKLTGYKKADQKALEYKTKQLLDLSTKDFITYLKDNFTEKDIRILIELSILENVNASWRKRRRRQVHKLKGDALYAELHSIYMAQLRDNQIGSFFGTGMQFILLLLGFLYIGYIGDKKTDIFNSIFGKDKNITINKKLAVSVLSASSAAYIFPKLRFKYLKTFNALANRDLIKKGVPKFGKSTTK